ncbi:MAG: RecB family exonuclease, partial [Terriglobia bacterium]
FYLSHWRHTGFDDEYQEETYRKAGLDQLRGFVEKHNALVFDANKIQMEQSFELEIEGIVLEGRIDQINFIDSGAAAQLPEVELTDYKTGRARTEKDAEKSLQLSVYALAARNILRLRPSRVTLYNLTTNEAVSAARTPQEMDSAVERICEAGADILAGHFPATPGFICRWCNYVPICPAHEG